MLQLRDNQEIIQIFFSDETTCLVEYHDKNYFSCFNWINDDFLYQAEPRVRGSTTYRVTIYSFFQPTSAVYNTTWHFSVFMAQWHLKFSFTLIQAQMYWIGNPILPFWLNSDLYSRMIIGYYRIEDLRSPFISAGVPGGQPFNSGGYA